MTAADPEAAGKNCGAEVLLRLSQSLYKPRVEARLLKHHQMGLFEIVA